MPTIETTNVKNGSATIEVNGQKLHVEPRLVELSPALTVLLTAIAEGDEKKHSFDYWMEECLTKGIDAVKRSREYAETNRNRKAFDEELARNPSAYQSIEALQGLMKKYRIGASK
jgi:hypothetical protein